MGSEKQKAINNRLLILMVFGTIVFIIGLSALMSVFWPTPRSVYSDKLIFFFEGTVVVLVVSALLHLFYFSWLSVAPVQHPPRSSAVPLKKLLLPVAALHLLVIIPAPAVLIGTFWIPGYGNYHPERIYLVGSIFLAGGFLLLGTRLFAPVFSGCHLGWRLPVLMLGGGAEGGLGFVIALTYVIGV